MGPHVNTPKAAHLGFCVSLHSTLRGCLTNTNDCTKARITSGLVRTDEPRLGGSGGGGPEGRGGEREAQGYASDASGRSGGGIHRVDVELHTAPDGPLATDSQEQPAERIMREIRWRTRVVGSFPIVTRRLCGASEHSNSHEPRPKITGQICDFMSSAGRLFVVWAAKAHDVWKQWAVCRWISVPVPALFAPPNGVGEWDRQQRGWVDLRPEFKVRASAARGRMEGVLIDV